MEFNAFDAMPNSDIFIAKRIQCDSMIWQLFDAYKFNHGYDIEISPNGMIHNIDSNDSFNLVDANFSSARRQNLKGAIVTCGLVVI